MAISPKQQGNYRKLVDRAYAAEAARLGGDIPNKEDWRRKLNVDTCGKFSTKQWTNADFDKVMLELGIIAGDDYWIGRASTNDVRQLRKVIEWFIYDLEFLEQRKIDWAYVQGICRQAKYSDSLLDCPAEHLEKVMMMVDEHVQRLRKRSNPVIERSGLPSAYFRKGCSEAEAIARFRHDHHHHIKHDKGEAA